MYRIYYIKDGVERMIITLPSQDEALELVARWTAQNTRGITFVVRKVDLKWAAE